MPENQAYLYIKPYLLHQLRAHLSPVFIEQFIKLFYSNLLWEWLLLGLPTFIELMSFLA